MFKINKFAHINVITDYRVKQMHFVVKQANLYSFPLVQYALNWVKRHK